MAEKSTIEWTDASWSPIRARNRATGKIGWHCEHASPGCVNCYSEGINKRLGTGLAFKPGHAKDIEVSLDETMLTAPLRWKRPRMIFVCSMTDLFADFVPDEWIDRMFAVMALAGQHVFQILTKRSSRMRQYFQTWPMRNNEPDRIAEIAIDMGYQVIGYRGRGGLSGRPLPNVWLGVSCEDHRRADERCSHLLRTPAAVRFVSAEPLLGPIDFTRLSITDPKPPRLSYGYDALRGAVSPWLEGQRQADLADPANPRLDWIIVGGESGHGARPFVLGWGKDIVRQCQQAGTKVFVKQVGSNPTNREGERHIARDRKGGDIAEWPAELQVRQMPEARHDVA
ncbi:MAG TPA: DUF5131 family protein [Sphingomicrobium sp.]|nr:DUF5131 family protein [Sphingomicrobium sp.]